MGPAHAGRAQELLNQVLGFGRTARVVPTSASRTPTVRSLHRRCSVTIIRAREPGMGARSDLLTSPKTSRLSITAYLTDYTHPDSRTFRSATLFINRTSVNRLTALLNGRSPAYLEISNSDLNLQAGAEGTPAKHLECGFAKHRRFHLHSRGRTVQRIHRAWLPGVDYADQIAAAFPPANPAESKHLNVFMENPLTVK